MHNFLHIKYINKSASQIIRLTGLGASAAEYNLITSERFPCGQ